MARSATIRDLFRRGIEAPVSDGESEAVFWIAKLNRYEREDCIRAAQISEARRRLALSEVGSDAYDHLAGIVASLDDEGLVTNLLGAQTRELTAKAVNKIRIDPEWKERIDILDTGREEAVGEDEERVYDSLREEYVAAIANELEELKSDQLATLRALTRERLEDAYREAWISERCRQVFQEAYSHQQLLIAVRTCKAVLGETGWDHGKCDHGQRAFGDIHEVRHAPDELVAALNEASDQLEMTLLTAKNSDRPEGSSAPSAQPSAPAASPASSPTETSATPAGI